jgi:hypothetical protein
VLAHHGRPPDAPTIETIVPQIFYDIVKPYDSEKKCILERVYYSRQIRQNEPSDKEDRRRGD